MGRERRAAEPRVQPDTAKDRPDVQQVFAEKPETQHQHQAGDGPAAHRHAAAPAQGDGDQRQRACIQEGRADTAQGHVIGDQRVAAEQDRLHAAQRRCRAGHEQPERREGPRQQDDRGQTLPVRQDPGGRVRHAALSPAAIPSGAALSPRL